MIENPGYEDASAPDQPGTPAHWTSTILSTLEETAEFTGDSAIANTGYELFEHGWGTLDPQILSVALTGVSLATERFESHWTDPVEQGFFVLTTLASFTFDALSQSIEDFNDGWGAPLDADIMFSPSELDAAEFDSESSEDFEESWGTTEFTLGSVTGAVFDIGGLSFSSATPQSAERFSLRARQRVRSNLGPNTMDAEDPPLLASVGDAVTFIAENGALPTPLSADVTYIVETFASNAVTLAAHPGATVVDLTADGTGANYVYPDPGRFWSEEL